MPIITNPATTTNSLAAKIALAKRKIAGEIPMTDERPVGSYTGQIKSAAIYHNPTSNKRTYRVLVALHDGEELVFASAVHDKHYLGMLKAVGLGDDEAALETVVSYDHLLTTGEGNADEVDRRVSELLLAIIGTQVTFQRVLKDATKPAVKDNLTNNWTVA
jgi:hypothetical protein